MSERQNRLDIMSCLLKAKNSEEFLALAFDALKKSNPRIGFAQLARRMGFSSRSFVRQLVLGQRRLNLTNYKQVASGFKLNAEATRYLGLLIESECEKNTSIRKKLPTELKHTREKLSKSLSKNVKSVKQNHVIGYEKWPLIYAALGSQEKGRSLSDIIKLTGEPHSVCDEILEKLVVNGLARKCSFTSVYFPSDDIIHLGELGHDKIFQRFFRENLNRNLIRLEREFNHPMSLFYSSAFSVKKADLPDLTKALQDVLEKYMVENETAEGDEIAVLSATLLPVQTP